MMQSVVYAIADAYGHVKIGKSNDLDLRLRTIQGAHAQPVRLVTFYRTLSPLRAEQMAHFMLADKRVRAEWFAVSDEEVIRVLADCVLLARGGASLPVWAQVPSLYQEMLVKSKGRAREGFDFMTEIKKHNLNLPMVAEFARLNDEDRIALKRKSAPDYLMNRVAAAIEVLASAKKRSAGARAHYRPRTGSTAIRTQMLATHSRGAQ